MQYFGELGQDVQVVRNDELSVAQIAALKPSLIVISPGPCTPNEAGVSLDVLAELSASVPIFGVCLGHQAIGQVFGGKSCVRARHARQDLDDPSPARACFAICRAHSRPRLPLAVVEKATLRIVWK